MTSPILKFQQERHESLKGLLLPLLLLAGAVVLQIKLSWHASFFAPLPGVQESFSAVLAVAGNESLLVSWLIKLDLSPLIWQWLTVFAHFLNIWLAFVVSRRVFNGRLGSSIAIAALVGMNPLGVEAIVWGCCFHKIISLTWVFLGLLIYQAHSHAESTVITAIRVCSIVALQILAFITWEWGLIFFPVIAMISLAVPRDGPKRVRKKNAILLLTSCGVVWIIGSLVSIGVIAEHPLLSINEIFSSIVLAPVEGLLPLLKEEQAYSLPGMILLIAVYGCLVGVSLCYKRNLALIAAFFISILPWALFEAPSGSDFYLSLPFLYLCLASFKDLRSVGTFFLFVYLFFQFIWMYERILVLENGRVQAFAIAKEREHLKAQIVNFPDRYKPKGLMVSSKVFFQGFKEPDYDSENLYKVISDPEDETAFLIVPHHE